MTLSLAQAMRIGYRSCAAVCAAGRVRQRVMKRQFIKVERRLRQMDPKDPKHRRLNARVALWQNLYSAQNYMLLAFTYDSDGTKGFKPRLEDLWQQMGRDVADLPPWRRFATKSPKAVVSFRNFNTLKRSDLDTLEDNFTGNDDQIPTDTFDNEFETLLTLLVNDLWKVLGMSRWCDQQLDRAPVDPALLVLWDGIITDARNMIRDAAQCHVKISNSLEYFQTGIGGHDDKYRDKFNQKPTRRFKCVQGLFAVDAATLPPKYAQRVEADLASYR